MSVFLGIVSSLLQKRVQRLAVSHYVFHILLGVLTLVGLSKRLGQLLVSPSWELNEDETVQSRTLRIFYSRLPDYHSSLIAVYLELRRILSKLFIRHRYRAANRRRHHHQRGASVGTGVREELLSQFLAVRCPLLYQREQLPPMTSSIELPCARISVHLDLVSVLVRCSGYMYRNPWPSGLISWLLPEVVRIPVHPIKSNPQLRQPAGSPLFIRLRVVQL